MTIWVVLVWHQKFDKVLNVFLYDDFEQACRGAAYLQEPSEYMDVDQCKTTVIEGVLA